MLINAPCQNVAGNVTNFKNLDGFKYKHGMNASTINWEIFMFLNFCKESFCANEFS